MCIRDSVGPALLAMHSPFEISSKLDVYETYRAYKVFFEGLRHEEKKYIGKSLSLIHI